MVIFSLNKAKFSNIVVITLENFNEAKWKKKPSGW